MFNARGVVVLNVVVGSMDVVVAATVVVASTVVVGGAVVCTVVVVTSVVVVITIVSSHNHTLQFHCEQLAQYANF